jgi:hypothetical protein
MLYTSKYGSSVASVEKDMMFKAHTIPEGNCSFLYCVMVGLLSTHSVYDNEESDSTVWTVLCVSCIGSQCGGDDIHFGEVFPVFGEDIVIHTYFTPRPAKC